MLRRWSSAVGLLALAVPWASSLAAPARAAAAPVARKVINLRPQVYQDHVVGTARPRDAGEVTRIWDLAEHVMEPHDPIVTPTTWC